MTWHNVTFKKQIKNQAPFPSRFKQYRHRDKPLNGVRLRLWLEVVHFSKKKIRKIRKTIFNRKKIYYTIFTFLTIVFGSKRP
jgi:hypothetical protein